MGLGLVKQLAAQLAPTTRGNSASALNLGGGGKIDLVRWSALAATARQPSHEMLGNNVKAAGVELSGGAADD